MHPRTSADPDMIRSLNRTLLLGTLSVALVGGAVSLAVSAQDPAAEAPAAEAPTADAAAPAPVAAAAAPAAVVPSAIVGSAERGKSLSYTCQGCHGVTGYKNAYPSYHVPRIVGQSPEYLTAALIGYKNGTRTHSTMQAQAKSFSDQDIADIAAYLSSLKK